MNGRRGSDPTDAAQRIMYQAWEATSRSKRNTLAKKTLKIWPLCAEAYVLLAEEEGGLSRKCWTAIRWPRGG
ncbi:hypothetical protein [Mesorhizobium delmotii]|uniref:Uncharacterized protein n=1 Tax=Mesorhizobium delmotii TaxID=1631247 RepID=A0A2P9AT00_9HYPH|nr:hypothetical protein [Mesorhizobium delmotii]SJM34235.1 hypothetical protein BQ8482_40017 [Mesorhizobium delmotii]